MKQCRTYRPQVGWTLVLLTLAVLLPAPIAAQSKPVRRILILNEVGQLYPAIDVLDHAIQDALANSRYNIDFDSESLDTIAFPDPEVQQEIRDFYIHKYQNRRPDVIITVGPSPLKFMVATHRKAFPGVPIVYCFPNRNIPSSPTLDSDFTGVENDMAPAKTLEVALRLQPDTEHVDIVGGAGTYDQQMQAVVTSALAPFGKRLDISYLTNFTMPELLERLRHLPSHTVILFTTVAQDAAGTRFTSQETGTMIANAANAPVFTLFDIYVGHGEVGGAVSSLREQGSIAGSMALKILEGAKAENIPLAKAAITYMFDWRALRRWGFKERDLPAGSVVISRELSVWERGKNIWITGISIIIGLAAVVVYLQFSRRQLEQARDAQARLSGLFINAQEKERRRLASELHDDFSQRLALLSFGLEEVAEALPESPQAVKQQVEELWNSASQIGKDLHMVSHRLHSSTLETLGLVPGVAALCKEFGGRHGLKVAFSSDNIPRDVPPDVALCLFRIVQEGLQNLKKHSGVALAEVNLYKVGEELVLSVQDEGCGFDTNGQKYGEGIGIQSMEERARLLGGHFEIHSKIGQGTKIEVHVPLQSNQAQGAHA